MSKKDEALKLAIEAMSCISQSRMDPLLKAIKACKEALESQEVGEHEIKQMLDDIEWYQNHTEELEKELNGKNWQGLTEDEIEYEFRESEAWQVPMTEDGKDKQERRHYVFVKACKIAEQKLKEKNYGI